MGEVEEEVRERWERWKRFFNCIRIVGESGGKRRGFVILYFCSFNNCRYLADLALDDPGEGDGVQHGLTRTGYRIVEVLQVYSARRQLVECLCRC